MSTPRTSSTAVLAAALLAATLSSCSSDSGDQWPSATECSAWTDATTQGVELRACALVEDGSATGTLEVRNTTDSDLRATYALTVDARDTPGGDDPAESSTEDSGADTNPAGETSELSGAVAMVSSTTREVTVRASWSNAVELSGEFTDTEVTITRAAS